MVVWQRHPKTKHFYTPVEFDAVERILYKVFTGLRNDNSVSESVGEGILSRMEKSARVFLPFVAISRRLLTAKNPDLIRKLTNEAFNIISDGEITRKEPDKRMLLAMSKEAVLSSEQTSLSNHLLQYEERYRHNFPNGHFSLKKEQLIVMNLISYMLGGSDWRQWDLRIDKTTVNDIFYIRGIDERAIALMSNHIYRNHIYYPEEMYQRLGWTR